MIYLNYSRNYCVCFDKSKKIRTFALPNYIDEYPYLCMKLRFTIFFLFIFLCLSIFAAKPIDEAKAAYNDGNYDSAIAQLQSILKRTPKDATANYYLGLALMATGDTDRAVDALLKAEDRGVAGAAKILAELALDEYRTDDAEEHLDNWAELLRKAKKSVPAEYNTLTSRMVMLKNMLERVEKIEVIDSVTVDSADFFAHYPLSPAAGKLLPASALPPNYSRAGSGAVYRPQSGREVLWSMPDSTGTRTLVSAGILDDGTMEAPAVIGGYPGEGGDADFPFLMPDGITLYFANNGENSLGGYDIFMTRRNDDGSLMQPQNLGMPYNSPANDFMLAIDETSGLGWWATDRNSGPGKLTIYTFIPSESRTNYDPADPEIADRARLSSIAATQIAGKDYNAMLERAKEAADTDHDGSISLKKANSHTLSLGDGRVVSSAAELSNPQARQAMETWLETQEKISQTEGMLRIHRASYGNGDHSVASDILNLEKSLRLMRGQLRRLANRVVRAERGLQ